ncbi:MAG: recombination mediator RecR [Gammaproteobacteria bacterium]
MAYNSLIGQLIDALRCLPGVGPKSAQRMAFYLLERNRDGARQLANALNSAVDSIQHCSSCRTLSETEICRLCASDARDRSLLCIVETPADVLAVERATGFKGLYFVLMGHLSPLDGIGPDDIGINLLLQRINDDKPQEVILATNPTVEGEATAHYISELLHARGAKVTRIAHGVPFGGELEYVDGGTLSHAFSERREI